MPIRRSPRGLLVLFLFCVLLLPAVALHARSAKDAEQTFMQAITRQRLYLRGLDGGEKIQARWNGKSLDFAPTEVHRLAPILIETVQFRARCEDHRQAAGGRLEPEVRL
jgi:hypothetical protein